MNSKECQFWYLTLNSTVESLVGKLTLILQYVVLACNCRCRHFRWPQVVPPVLRQPDQQLHRVYLNWWARKKVMSLDEAQRSATRLKIIAHACFNNEMARDQPDSSRIAKKPLDLRQQYDAVYGDVPAQMRNAGMRVINANSDNKLLFAAPALKLNRGGKVDRYRRKSKPFIPSQC